MALLREIIYTIITTILPIIMLYLIRYLSKKFDKIKEDTADSIVSNTINETLDLIITAVSSTSQTYVDQMKKDGTFTEESQLEAFDTTKRRIMALLSERAIDILSSVYNDVEEWINIQIESAVRAQKISILSMVEEDECDGNSN